MTQPIPAERADLVAGLSTVLLRYRKLRDGALARSAAREAADRAECDGSGHASEPSSSNEPGLGADRAAAVVLFALDHHGPQRASELVELLHADKSTISRYIDAVVNLGWVQRQPDPDDRRAHQLVITEPGRERARALRREREARIAPLVADWTDEELHMFVSLFDRLVQTANQKLGESQ